MKYTLNIPIAKYNIIENDINSATVNLAVPKFLFLSLQLPKSYFLHYHNFHNA